MTVIHNLIIALNHLRILYSYRILLFTIFIAVGQWMNLTPGIAQEKNKVRGLINSDQYTEFAPSISADGKTMIIESNKSGTWKLYESKLLEDGSWSEPANIDKINTFGDGTDLIGGPNISYDGNILYFFSSNKKGYGDMDIYFSTREGNSWGTPVNIGPPINTIGYEGFPSVSSDGKTLYFSKLKTDLDNESGIELSNSIFQSKKDPNGNWLTPEPLPYPINHQCDWGKKSKEDVMLESFYTINNICDWAPRIMADNRTLIFSSYRSGTIGGYDLFQSQVDDDGEWSEPVPLTFINTPQSDMFASISASGDLMYFNTSDDIWSVHIPENLRQFKNIVMQGFIRDEDTGTGLSARIRVRDARTSEEIFVIENNALDGGYGLVLAAGRTYNVEFYKEGYSCRIYSYDLQSRDAYDIIDQDVSLFKTVRLRLNIHDKELFEPLPGEVNIDNDSSGERVANLINDPGKGYIIVNLPIGSEYKINVDLTHFTRESFSFNINRQIMYRDFERDVELIPEKMKVSINVSDISNSTKVKCKVINRNKSRDEVIEVASNEIVSLRIGDRYEIEATSDKGYFFASTTVDVTTDGIRIVGEGSNVSRLVGDKIEMKLTPIIVNNSLNLNEILFESGSAQISEVSFNELNRVMEVMKNNPTLRVEIAAYTDNVGSESFNLTLSKQRAQSVVEYLISQNISKKRFIAKGYGELKPVVPNDSDENRYKNRRVEMKVLEILNQKI